MVPEGIHSPEVPRSSRVWGWKGREEQGRREDKPAVICLFNWLKCSKENFVVILALGLDRVQAPGFGLAAWAAGGPGLPFPRRLTGWEAAARSQRWLLLSWHFRNLKE